MKTRLKPAQVQGLMALALAALLSGCVGDGGASSDTTAELSQPTLVGLAALPAATEASGPVSGQYLGVSSSLGQALPLAQQPVQGFSALLPNGDGSYLAMADNGFGTLENSADFRLRVYTVRPALQGQGGNGSVQVEKFIELRDPNKHVPFAITHHFSTERVLTGADFDIESVQRAADGTLWFGDEFGPYLLHTDATGVVLEPPIPLPDPANAGTWLRSPQNPEYEEASAVRVMNAVRAHAQAHGVKRTPVFSPYWTMLKYDRGGVKSSPDAHYARGSKPQPGLRRAGNEVFDVASLQAAGYSVVTWTVNDLPTMTQLLKAGVNGMISDRPDLLLQALREFDANGDGKPGDYLLADGRVDTSKFDAQGHRGARNLRPENTLPAFEAALDNLVSTLETDSGITRDGVSVLKHDPYIEVQKCRRADGQPYTERTQEQLIKDLTLAEIQSQFVCDKLFRGDSQLNAPELSPVSALLAQRRGYVSPYVLPRTQDLFDLVQAYIDYYSQGAGAQHPQAAVRVANARSVRFNIETKVNPRSDLDNHGKPYLSRTVPAQQMADTLAQLIVDNGMQERADIQSFDFRTLLRVQEKFPAIRTVYLFGDFPIYDDPANTDDGTNMQDEAGANTPWMAGLPWPYRSTQLDAPARVRRSGGFEGMARSPDGRTLYPLLEQPLQGDDAKRLLLSEFDLATRRYTGRTWGYRLNERGSNIGEFLLYNDSEGLVIERDNTQGDLQGFKKIYQVSLGAAGSELVKTELVDLLKLADPQGLAAKLPTAQSGDVGLGSGTYAMPFLTIESVAVLDERTLLLVNDNNFPLSAGRHVGGQTPDDNEFVLIRLPKPLVVKKP
ncbi:esterase-like activity of phytase family protein [Roseateles sp. BYS180W]|uniref:Esterase-like activity of phytase family protein n=1 Tax=Roseateles rivi TaxID=3299028 RepID=A0ABW7FSA1_9BURK